MRKKMVNNRKFRMLSVVMMMAGLSLFFQNCSPAPQLQASYSSIAP